MVGFYGDVFDMEWCYKGCHYELGWSVGPNLFLMIIPELRIQFWRLIIPVMNIVYLIYMTVV